MAEKVTVMRLMVDHLQCEKCYKKVKKVLCKFPQIRDQLYDEKQNIVTIKVVCCSPEKIRDKICGKGRGAIKSIEIVEPPKPKPPEPKKEPEKEKEPEKPKAEPDKKKESEKPKDEPVVVRIGVCCTVCYEGRPGGQCFHGYCRPPPCYCYYGRPVYDQYCSNENAFGCSIM